MKKSILILLASALVFVLAARLAMGLTVKSNMDDMLPKDSDALKASQNFDKHFESQDQAIIIIHKREGVPLDRFEEVVPQILEDLAAKFSRGQGVGHFIYQVDKAALKEFAWAYGEQTYYDTLREALASQDPEALKELLKTIQNQETSEGNQYFVSETKTSYMMLLSPNMDPDDFDGSRRRFYQEVTQAIDEIKHHDSYHDLAELGLAGGAFIQDIEGDMVAFDGMGGTFIITLLVVTLLVVIFLRRLMLPLLSLYPLLLGTVFAAACGYLIYGYINMFSISFGMLLVGLGIDYAVHLLTRFDEELGKQTVRDAISIAVRTTGGSIIIGALTTAMAFFMFQTAKFKAFSQMGILSAIGILFLCISMLLIMPALMYLIPGKETKSIKGDESGTRPKKESDSGLVKIPLLARLTGIHLKHPIIVYSGIALGLVVLIGPVLKTNMNSDVSAVYPDDLPSANWVALAEAEFDLSLNQVSTYVLDEESLEDVIPALEGLSRVSEVASAYNFMPPNQEEKLSLLIKLKETLALIGLEVPLIDEWNLRPMTPYDLPLAIRQLYISETGAFRIDIMARGNLFDKEVYQAFSKEIQGVLGEEAVGLPVVMQEITDLVKKDIIRISLLCLLATVLVSALAFKSLLKGLKATLPVLITLYTTLGLMPLFGIELNLFSVAAFPLIIGIGIDSSIHLFHRLQEEGSISVPMRVASTGRGIVLTSLTTMVGFGSLSMISHPGMANFGMAVALGMGLNLVFTLLLVPHFVKKVKAEVLDPQEMSPECHMNLIQ